MYKCNNCCKIFYEPNVAYETHGFTYPPYEKILVCPYCKENGVFEEVEDEKEVGVTDDR